MIRRSVLIIVALALAAPGAQSAAAEFRFLSRTLIEGPAHIAAFSDDCLLLGTGCGLAIFRDGRPLENPGYIPLEGEPKDMVLNGSLAYVAAFDGGLEVIDFSDPLSPRETFRHGGINATTCAMAGGSLFVSDVQNRLFAFDLRNPREPHLMETKRTFSGVRSLAGDGEILVIVQQATAMIYRAGPGGALQKLSEAAIEGRAQRGILRDGILYVLNDKGAVLCWNLDKRGAPFSLKPLQARGVVDLAVGENDGILLTDLEFLLPFEIKHAAGPGTEATKVRLKSGKAFTLESVNSYGQPIATQNPSLPETQRAARVFIGGQRCAVLSPFGGMRLYKLEKGTAKLAGTFATRGFAINLFAAKGLLYLANSLDGVRIARVGENGTLDWIGHIQTTQARDVALAGTNLIIADGSGGLKVADVSDPTSPKIIGRHQSPYFMSAVAVRDGRAYCAGGLGGVEIVDVSQPSRPSLVWRQDCSESRGIDVDDRFLYFSDGNVGFQIYSLTKDKPVPVSTFDTRGWNCDCLVAKNTAYLADGGAGIVIVDVGNRKKPRTLGSLSLNTLTREVYVFNNTLFAAGHTKGIAAVDVSNPTKPAVAAWYDTADDGRGVFADANFVYAASGSGGVYVLKYLH